jgi:hypothetical protein
MNIAVETRECAGAPDRIDDRRWARGRERSLCSESGCLQGPEKLLDRRERGLGQHRRRSDKRAHVLTTEQACPDQLAEETRGVRG